MKPKIKKYVILRLYKGSEIFTGEDGKVKNENQEVTLQIDSLEFNNYVKHLPFSQYGKVKLEKTFQVETSYNDENGTFHPEVVTEIDTPTEVVQKIASMFVPKAVQMTPDQEKIAELTAKVEAMSKSQPNPENGKTPKISTDEQSEPTELDALRLEYEALLGKKPSHLMKEDRLREKIDHFKSLNVSE